MLKAPALGGAIEVVRLAGMDAQRLRRAKVLQVAHDDLLRIDARSSASGAAARATHATGRGACGARARPMLVSPAPPTALAPPPPLAPAPSSASFEQPAKSSSSAGGMPPISTEQTTTQRGALMAGSE
jgi:hypothetical protein